MEDNRRGFLKAAGLTIIGFGSGGSLLAGIAHGLSGKKADPNVKRYAMVIDTELCAKHGNCTACMDKCHLTHNVPDLGTPKEDVKWIWKEELHYVFSDEVHERSAAELQHRKLMVLCNHCDNPPCVRVCPTQATFRRPEDGIVMMDQHRCIGCRYCISACPYGARSFNWRDPKPYIPHITADYPHRTKGVVEKCTFCAERLARGEDPVCYLACKEAGVGAIKFGDLNNPKSEVHALVRDRLLSRRRAGLGTRPQVYYSL